jgi:hypothetical protein
MFCDFPKNVFPITLFMDTSQALHQSYFQKEPALFLTVKKAGKMLHKIRTTPSIYFYINMPKS